MRLDSERNIIIDCSSVHLEKGISFYGSTVHLKLLMQSSETIEIGQIREKEQFYIKEVMAAILPALRKLSNKVGEALRSTKRVEVEDELPPSAQPSPRPSRDSKPANGRRGSTVTGVHADPDHPYTDLCIYNKQATLLKIIDDKYFAAAQENGNVLIINYHTREIFAEIIYNRHAVSHMLVIPGALLNLESLPGENNCHRPLLVTVSADIVAVFDVYNRKEEKRLLQSVYIEDPEIRCLNMIVCDSPPDTSKESFDRKDVMIVTGGSRLSIFKVSTQLDEVKKPPIYLKNSSDCCHPLDSDTNRRTCDCGSRIHTVLDSQLYIISCSEHDIECYGKPKKGYKTTFTDNVLPTQVAGFDMKTNVTSVLPFKENQLLVGMNTGVIFSLGTDRMSKNSGSHKRFYDENHASGQILQLTKYDKENRVIALMIHEFVILDNNGQPLIKSSTLPSIYCSLHVIDRPYIATCHTSDSSVLLWNIPELDHTRKCVAIEPRYQCSAHDNYIKMLIDIPEGFVTSASDGLTIVWKNSERMMMTRFQSIIESYNRD